MKQLKISLKKLETMPTLHSGQYDNLKYETKDTRLWLSRMTIEDGMEYNNQVTVEMYIYPKTSSGVDQTRGKIWQITKQYEAK